MYFTYRTKRKPTEIGINFYNELILFVNVVIWSSLDQEFSVYNADILFED